MPGQNATACQIGTPRQISAQSGSKRHITGGQALCLEFQRCVDDRAPPRLATAAADLARAAQHRARQLHFGPVKPRESQRTAPAITLRRVEIQPQIGVCHPGFHTPRQRQQNRRAIGQAQPPRQTDPLRNPVRRDRNRTVQHQGAGIKRQRAQLELALLLAQSLGPKPDIGAEKFGIFRQEQRGEVAGKISAERQGIIFAGLKRYIAFQPGLAAGCQQNPCGEIINRARALDLQHAVRRARNLQQRHGNTTRRFAGIKVDLGLPGRVAVARDQGYMPRRPATRPRSLKRDAPRSALEGDRGADAALNLLPQQAFAQNDPRGFQLLDRNRDRQIGQGKARGLGCGGFRGADGCAGDVHLCRRQFGNIDHPAKQRRPAPVQHDAGNGDPDALAIGNRQFVYFRTRRKRAAKAGDRHLAVVRRKVVFQKRGQRVTLIILRQRRKRQRQNEPQQ